jgi:hypothetical protein
MNAERSEDAIQRFERQSRPSAGGNAGSSFATGFLNERALQISGRRAADAELRACMANQGWMK